MLTRYVAIALMLLLTMSTIAAADGQAPPAPSTPPTAAEEASRARIRTALGLGPEGESEAVTSQPAEPITRTPAPAQIVDRTAEAKALRESAREWQLTGYATMAGGLVYEILGSTALATRTEYCTVGRVTVTCTTLKDPDMAAVYGGVAIVGVGAIMTIIGSVKNARAKRLAPDIRIGPHAITVTKRLSF